MPDSEKFIATIKENEGLIFKITTLYVETKADSQDLYQEIVYQLWKSFDNFSGRSQISTWIYRVALNTALVYLKKKKQNQMQKEIDPFLLERLNSPDPQLEDRIKLLYQNIKQLNEIERGIILLYLEGKTYKEIATITGFSTTNVGTRLGRIKHKLKSMVVTNN